ncbi:MAG TPA: NAD(P)/FAD-dependent oxidoreductase [Gemmatimonadaceae bacterium]
MSASADETDAGPRPVDVAVVGAGAAGLVASRRLADAGRSVLLLDARDRVGGRIWTVPGPIELGAEFVHGHPASTLALLREAGAGTVECTGDRWEVQDARVERTADRFGELHRLLREAASLESDVPVSRFLARVVEDVPRFRRTAEWLARVTEDYDAADPRRASLMGLVAEWTRGAPVETTPSRPRGSYATLIEHLTHTLDPANVELRLESIVRAVRWSNGRVELEVERRGALHRHRARALIVTLPLGVLQAPPDDPAAVRFHPPLLEKRAALAGLAMGSVLKVVLRFREPFWERVDDGRWRNTAFLHAPALPFRTFWTTLPERTDRLTAWVGGPRAAALSGQPDDAIVARAVESVRSLFRGRVDVVGLLEEARFHDWSRDPRARGAYSYVTVGGMGAGRRLAEPVAGTLFFAGEATDDTGEASTVAGAIASGERAAREVIAAS